jgi:putative protein-disulfide isomerase
MTDDSVKNDATQQAGSFDVTIYTDPLCCWSWGAITHWERMIERLGETATWQLRMGGLIPSWQNFTDEVHSVTRPAQMGPVWMHAAQLVHRPINTRIWHTDPPSSSYPACVAVKAAQMQSPEMGWEYFKLLQHAVMTKARNVAKANVLLSLSAQLAASHDCFDPAQFELDYNSEAAMNAFRKDLQDAQYNRVKRLPTMIIRKSNGEQMLLAGFRTYDDMLQLLKQADANLVDDR